ncbi:hypothetical protein [Clostridium magnum]|uniref:Uncharacterized protein n=1 Tax=Clostridium magnum DSM 2767 TaxID=1121326 RepID=A0A162QR93_9CLOT|nr:hypothetical protein [Clostridium magnum]KZL88859.1 hypothetical protein CLMAG_57630 [Clostridium magnum DSM 2767]SHI50320.1 hypothetical protein SAMN02745944_04405 [Clostridium magnum DSM 2767]
MELKLTCGRVYPNDFEKQLLKRAFKENRAILKDGENLVLTFKQGVVFFNMSKGVIEVIDFVFTSKIIDIK